ncbi:MAG: hypothetical protein Kow0031_14290 [Anaerolineae bacterium]
MKPAFTPTWGIRIVALWALVLALLAVSHLLLLTLAVELYEGGNQPVMWAIFGMNIIFAVGFAAAAYGLWGKWNWGRIAFLWLIAVWSIFNFISLVTPGAAGVAFRQSPGQWLLTGLKYGAALVIPLIYLNLPQIRAQFQPEAIQNLTSED